MTAEFKAATNTKEFKFLHQVVNIQRIKVNMQPDKNFTFFSYKIIAERSSDLIYVICRQSYSQSILHKYAHKMYSFLHSY